MEIVVYQALLIDQTISNNNINVLTRCIDYLQKNLHKGTGILSKRKLKIMLKGCYDRLWDTRTNDQEYHTYGPLRNLQDMNHI